MSVFKKYESKAWPYSYKAKLRVKYLCGGVPFDEKAIEGWLKTKTTETDDLIRQEIIRIQIDRGISEAEATEEVSKLRGLKGFKRNPDGQLIIEGRQVKAAIKEAASVARAAGKLKDRWGQTNKGLLGFVAEHIQVREDRIPLGVKEPSGVLRELVHTSGPGGRRSAFSMTEYLDEAEIEFTVQSDWEFTEEEWAMIWLTGQLQGLGADRSQSRGRYIVEAWEKLK